MEALRWAISQAQLTSARVEAVTSWQTLSQYGVDTYSAQVDWADNAERTLDTAIKESNYDGPVEIQSLVQQGHPARVLVDAAAGAKLLVVGSRGHGGFAGLLLGSVSDYVIAHAPCPVLVIRDQPPAAG